MEACQKCQVHGANMLYTLAQIAGPTKGNETVWFLGLLALAIGTMVGGYVYIWRMFVSRWEECEEGHKATQQQLIDVTGEMGVLKGKVDVLTSLSQGTLAQVHGHTSNPSGTNQPNPNPPNSSI